MAKHVQKLALRYARSLLNAVKRDSGQVHASGGRSPAQTVADQLRRFVAEYWSDPTLVDAMQNPMFEKGQRQQALASIARQAGLPEVATRFLEVVFERDRIAALPQIVDSYAGLTDEEAGIVKVRVVTAQPVDGEERHTVEENLRRKIQGSLSFEWREDPEILGGMLVSYGAKVLDGSLRGRLEQIERRLNA